METKLSVNINKIATLRNARGGNLPDLVQFAIDCELFGADGITIHPRPDERHITTKDVGDLAKVVRTEYNIEGYPDDRFMQLLEEHRPAQATLVPDPPGVLTSNTGWDLSNDLGFLKPIIEKIHAMGIRSSLFVNGDEKSVIAAAKLGVNRIEFYTGPYASQFDDNKTAAIAPYIIAAKAADDYGVGINAGHDLNLKNLRYFKENLPNLLEVSIGHALISDALYLGIENTIRMYKHQLNF
jgi:pyridoxine 5-phosphate synthase